MKKLFTIIVSIMILLGTSLEVFADTYVKGYYRKNGTYVQGHYRSDKNGTKYDNWSTKGNYNPYTGKAGTHKVDGYSNYNYTPSYNSYNNYNSYTPSYYNSYSKPTYNYSDYKKKSCSDTYGIMSTDNGDGTCSCVSGYTFGKDSQCVSKTKYCQENHGYGATYNSLNDQCECSYGYEVKNNQCVYKTKSYNYYNTNNKYSKIDKIVDEWYLEQGENIKSFIPVLEKMLDTEYNLEKIELIKYIIEKIKNY